MRKTGILTLAVVLLAAVAFAGAVQEQGKPRIGVLRFTNHTSAGWWSSSVADELSDMLASELVSTKAFTILERGELDPVLYEQDLSQTDRISADTKTKIGNVKGAQYLVAATVSSYEEQTKTTGAGVRLGGLSLGGSKEKTYIAVDLKIINTETSEIVDTRTIEAEAKGTGIGAGFSYRNFSISGADAQRTPTGKAIRACVVYISEYLACSLVQGQDAGCMKKWNEMEEKRRERTKGVIDIK